MTTRLPVVLVGPPGAGKTSVGGALAGLLGLPFRDTDAEVERRRGLRIAEIFVTDGEPAFRDLERTEVLDALEVHDGVLALGGGSVLDADTQQALTGHQVVFLDVTIAHAAKRVGFDRSRPLLGINPRAQWIRLMEARRHLYERAATLRIDTSGRTPQDVAAQIVDRLDSGEPDE